MAATFEIEKASDGQFFFRLKAGNGEIILSSEQYKAKANAQGGIDSVKANAAVDARYERKTSTGAQPYFVLKPANDETLRRRHMYASPAALGKGIESVKANAPAAPVEDPTRPRAAGPARRAPHRTGAAPPPARRRALAGGPGLRASSFALARPPPAGRPQVVARQPRHRL